MRHKTTASDRIHCLHRCIENDDRDAITLLKAARVDAPAAEETAPAALHAS